MNETPSILLVDKAQDWTSHDVAAYMRGLLKIKKVGHSGTLDPMATGLLILLLGKATKLQSEYQGMPKTYRAQVFLGVETDTWDAKGQTVNTLPVKPLTVQDLLAALETMTGEITHPIPYYSAKKVGGQAMYKQAREGVNIEKESTVTIYKWENVKLNGNIIEFDVTCSSGTYVRSLAYMLGKKLGTAAHICALRRLSIGDFHVDRATAIEDIKKMSCEDVLKCVKTL